MTGAGIRRVVAALVPLVALACLGGSPRSAAAPLANSVVPFGTTGIGANAVADANAPIVGMAATPGRRRLLARRPRTGASSATATPAFFGSAGRRCTLNAPIVGMAATPERRTATGWWRPTAASSATATPRFFGSTGSLRLNAPIVGMAATPDGDGYWLVAADGGIFSYGDAALRRLDRGRSGLNAPGRRHGGDARRRGLLAGGARRRASSPTGTPSSTARPGRWRSTRRSSGMAATPDGGGYWLVARDGGVFTFGDARYFGSLGGTPAARPRWWASPPPPDGGGLLAGPRLRAPLAGKVVGIDPGHNGLNDSAPDVINQPVFNGTGRRALRHDRHGDRQRLHRGAVQLQRGHRPAGRPAGGGSHRRADPPEQRRRGPVRHDPGRHHQRRPRRAWRSTSTPTGARRRARLHRARADGGRSQRRRDRVLGHLRHHPARRLRGRHAACRSAPTTASTGCSPATTWPDSTSPRCPRCSSNAATCATRPTPRLLVIAGVPAGGRGRHRPGHHDVRHRPPGLISPGARGAPARSSCRRARARTAPSATRSTCATAKVASKGIPASSAWAGPVPPALDPGQGEVAVEGRLPPAGRGHHGTGRRTDRGGEAVQARARGAGGPGPR